MNQLLRRGVTAVAMAGLLIWLLFATPPVVCLGVLGLLLLLAAWEWSAFLGLRRNRQRLAYAALAGLVLLLGYLLIPARIGLLPVLLLSLAWWAGAFVWILRFPTPIPPLLAGIAGLLVLGPAWIALAVILGLDGDGPALVLLVLAIVWSADIGAYFVGRRLGRVKLAPRVSPGKTWEGVAGGLAGAVLAAVAGGSILGYAPAVMVPLGLAVAAISVVGDLTESMFKRNVGLKDSGHLFPGHGGVLDRVDSITAAVPLFALMLYWLGRLPP